MKYTASFVTGAHAGNTLNNLFTGLMLSWFPGNWPVVFYVWASLGALWTIVFSLTTYAFPTDYKDMSEKEAAILTAYLDETSRKEVNIQYIIFFPPLQAALICTYLMVCPKFGYLVNYETL